MLYILYYCNINATQIVHALTKHKNLLQQVGSQIHPNKKRA